MKTLRQFTLNLLTISLLAFIIAPADLKAGSVRGYKYEIAKGVFKDIKKAIGNSRKIAPNFEMLDTRNSVAMMNFDKRLITLEEATYDICASFGKDSLNALALLIGHELTHYYHDHNWYNEFGTAYADLEIGKKAASQGIDLVQMETQADEYGAIYGYMAGYNTLDIGPKLLESIYREYSLDDQIEGYPSLSERKKIMNESEQELRDLIPVFEGAVYLNMLDHHEHAASCYEHILEKFQSREILNNLAVCKAQHALSYFDEKEVVAYHFPFEISAETRLSLGTRGSGAVEDPIMKREQLLEESKSLCEQAIYLDGEYLSARLNLALVHELLGESEQAESVAESLKRKARKQENQDMMGQALNALAIIYDRQGDKESALEFITEARELSNHPSIFNNQGLISDDVVPTAQMGFAGQPKTEQVQNLKIYDAAKLLVDSGDYFENNINPAIALYTKEVECSQIIWVDSEEQLLFFDTGNDYTLSSSAGVKVGDQLGKVEELMGAAHKVLNAREGSYLLYPHSKLIFFLDQEEKVKKWTVYGNLD